MINNAFASYRERSDEEDSLESYTESEKLEHLKKWENSSLEVLLKRWGEKAGGQRWMHMNSASYWRHKDQQLNLTGIVLSSVVSVSSLTGAFEYFFDSRYVMTFVGFIGMLTILNQSMIRFYNCTETAALHETAARQFGNFQRHVTTKLSLSRKERGPPNSVLEYALRENDRLYKENVEPHHKSNQAFFNHFKKKITEGDFSMPDYVSDTLRIDVFDNNPRYDELTLVGKKSLDLRKPGEMSAQTHGYNSPTS
jgi:hypothetical protein